MSTGTIILLGAFAGLTIYLGLPIAFLKKAPQSFKIFANMLATGVLIFLLYDVVSKATEPINGLIDQVHKDATVRGALFFYIFLVIFGLALGLIGLVYFNKYVIARFKTRKLVLENKPMPEIAPELVLAGVEAAANGSTQVVSPSQRLGSKAIATVLPAEMSPRTLALMIATGIGFHNFSEGLAIGQSAATGALQLAIVLIIGFGLHNMTEGFGIAGPLTGQTVSWKFIALTGLIGGGPTFLGTVLGVAFHSTALFVFCLSLAAGAIIYVVAELLGVARRCQRQDIVMWGLLVGFLLGYITDLIVTYAGA